MIKIGKVLKTALKIARKSLVIGIIATSCYNVGIERGRINTELQYSQQSNLYALTNTKYELIHPKSKLEYLVDFENLTISPSKIIDYSSLKNNQETDFQNTNSQYNSLNYFIENTRGFYDE